MTCDIEHHLDCTFISNYKLNSDDLVLISDAAKELAYLDGQVRWLKAALVKAKEEKNLSKVKIIRYFSGMVGSRRALDPFLGVTHVYISSDIFKHLESASMFSLFFFFFS